MPGLNHLLHFFLNKSGFSGKSYLKSRHKTWSLNCKRPLIVHSAKSATGKAINGNSTPKSAKATTIVHYYGAAFGYKFLTTIEEETVN